MKILFFCPRWGQEAVEWDVFLQKVKQEGYDGVEASLPYGEKEKAEILNGLEKHGLQFIGQHYETTEKSFDVHYQQFEQRLHNLASSNPLFINSQTGKDYYTFEQNTQLIALATTVSNHTGVNILHETHRGKFSFAAHIASTYLAEIEDLRITLDISHWCNTAESFLHDQQEAVDLAISRTDHIHSRVGYPEGPQITDPRAPEWKEALNFHLSCWDKVVAKKQAENAPLLTITSEFGAPPYLPLLPYTKQPVVSQWDVNVFMMELLKERYK
ncbi:sugar phosphate isomerase/epimerase [uncultured Mucilaginibacter sp.]|uniref:sugar phosphate isomerase/epimerase n=1 Tax=uncultured Mucilaginibacter sp. TaxID=797541 RepID=UPI0025F36D18|nr:sugar phosphate isomerase/epimerase [uncultured Mucilaginibacter sp.]